MATPPSRFPELQKMKRKILLMGKSGSGKTSMRSIIFSNYIAKDTRRLGATIDVEHSQVRFLGDLVLNLWDCGGQQAFMENYLSSQREHIFRNVAVFIYVLDVESREPDKDLYYYKNCLEAIKSNSKDAMIYCLVHKMDLVNDQVAEQVYQDRVRELKRRADPLKVTCFGTSIWNESLYRAWSGIVYALIPNAPILERHLTQFAKVNRALEVVLFEKTTFLVISRSILDEETSLGLDASRFEKISNIVKQFKLSCSKIGNQLNSIEIRQDTFSVLLDSLTTNTYIMVIVADPKIRKSRSLYLSRINC